MLVLRVLLDYCHGKPWSYPSDESLAEKTGLGLATVSRCLTNLAEAGVVRIIRRKGSLRRYLVILSHPHAAAFLAEPGTHSWKSRRSPRTEEPTPSIRGIHSLDSGDSIPQSEGSSEVVSVKPRAESNVAVPPAPNANEDPEPLRPWREIVADLGGPETPAAAPPEPPARPAINRAERDAIVAAVLGPQEPPPEAAGPRLEESTAPAAGTPQGAYTAVHNDVAPIDPEAETIKALAKLKPGATPGEIMAATIHLATLFRDPGSRAYYRSVCNSVARGELRAESVAGCVRSSRGAERPAAAFTAGIGRCRRTAETRRTAPGQGA